MSLREWRRNVRLRLEAARREVGEPLPIPTGSASGRCFECQRPIDDHHLICGVELLGKSTEQGNKYFHTSQWPPPLRPEADQGVNNA